MDPKKVAICVLGFAMAVPGWRCACGECDAEKAKEAAPPAAREASKDEAAGLTPNQKAAAALKKTQFADAATHEAPLADFLALLGNAKTQERIVHTLKTGKPLRN